MKEYQFEDCIYYVSKEDENIIYQMFAIDDEDPESDVSKFDFHHIHAYICKGYDLIGSSCNTRDPNRHFLEKTNNYLVFEVPAKYNKGLRMTGDFLVAIKNLSFQFWNIGFMRHRFRKQGTVVKEDVQYTCFGEIYPTLSANNSLSYHCTTGRGKCVRGWRGKVFDGDQIRKYVGYHTTMKTIYKHFGIRTI